MPLIHGVNAATADSKHLDKPCCRSGISTTDKQADFTTTLDGKRLRSIFDIALYARNISFMIFGGKTTDMIPI